MDETRVIVYRTKPECAEENARLIGDVFTELDERGVEGVSYVALRLDDGVSFIHVAVVDPEDNPLASSPAFAAFQAGIGDRCEEGPSPSTATVLGSHRVSDLS